MSSYVPKARTKKLDFTGTQYEGLEATISLSIPYGFLEDLKTGDENKILDVIEYMLKDWNLCDIKTKEPLGAPDRKSIRKAPLDVLMAIFTRAMEEIQAGGMSKNEDTTLNSS